MRYLARGIEMYDLKTGVQMVWTDYLHSGFLTFFYIGSRVLSLICRRETTDTTFI